MDQDRRHSSPFPQTCFEREKPSHSSTHSKSSHQQNSQVDPQPRSRRKTAKQKDTERRAQIEDAVRNNLEDGLESREIPNKGRGIFSTRSFNRGDFIVEYVGDLIKSTECTFRESIYGITDTSGSSYMFYFKHNGELLCVDATEDRGRLGRLTNHSRRCNMMAKAWTIDNVPRLLLMAKVNIPPGVELTVDYGDRSKTALKKFVWLKQ